MLHTTLSDYKIEKTLGKGAYGKVKRVVRKSDKKVFCIKFINLQESDQTFEEAEVEVIVWRKLNHPNIAQYYDHFQDKKNFCIVMEYIEGKNLRDFIKISKKNKEKIQEKILLNLFAQMASALNYCHHQNCIHRDVKPENFLLTKSYEIKLIDFGISKTVIKKTGLASTICGTPLYFSPELLKQKPYNFLTDVWSLGCVFYELMTFRHPIGYDMNLIFQNLDSEQITPIDENYVTKIKRAVYYMLDYEPVLRLRLDAFLQLDVLSPYLPKEPKKNKNQSKLKNKLSSIPQSAQESCPSNSSQQLSYSNSTQESSTQDHLKSSEQIPPSNPSYPDFSEISPSNLSPQFLPSHSSQQFLTPHPSQLSQQSPLSNTSFPEFSQHPSSNIFQTPGQHMLSSPSYPIFNESNNVLKMSDKSDLGEQNFQLGLKFLYGKDGITQNLFEASKYFKISADQNHPIGQLYYGISNQLGWTGETNLSSALSYYYLSANQSNAQSMYLYSNGLYRGFSHGRKIQEAISFLKKAADAGLPEAMVNYGVFLIDHQNGNEAGTYIKRAAEQNNLLGLYYYANMLPLGTIQDETYLEKLEYYKKAAEGGNVNAMVQLGMQMRNLSNTIVQHNSMLQMFKQAAELGSIKGMIYYALSLEKFGYNHQPDPKLAVQYYKKAADLGDSDGQVQYARCILESVDGVKRDPLEAYQLLYLSSACGNPNADAILKQYPISQ